MNAFDRFFFDLRLGAARSQAAGEDEASPGPEQVAAEQARGAELEAATPAPGDGVPPGAEGPGVVAGTASEERSESAGWQRRRPGRPCQCAARGLVCVHRNNPSGTAPARSPAVRLQKFGEGGEAEPVDGEWLACLLERRVLQSNFAPSPELRLCRELMRQLDYLLEQSARLKNGIEELCGAAGARRSPVASGLIGAPGRRILRSILHGKHDTGCGRDQWRSHCADLEQALEGTFDDRERGLVQIQLRHLEWLEQQAGELQLDIEEEVAPYQELIGRLMSIPGVNQRTAWTLLGELGTDLTAFTEPQQLAAWAGLEGDKATPGRKMGGPANGRRERLQRTLREAAREAAHAQGTYLQATYHRARERAGQSEAIWLVAHHLISLVFHVIKEGQSYREPAEDSSLGVLGPPATAKWLEGMKRMGHPAPRPVAVDDPGLAEPGAEVIPAIDRFGVERLRQAERRRPGRPCLCAVRGLECTHGKGF